MEQEYCCGVTLDLYDSPTCSLLATQAAQGRYLTLLSDKEVNHAIKVLLREDNYIAWLPSSQLIHLKPAATPYRAIALSREKITELIPSAIAYIYKAMERPNYYLWGGTVGPNYDCSGLIQAAFASVGIWLPRDSFQQAEFTQPILASELLPGDLIFFGEDKVNHVALYLGDNSYIHSSGPTMGRNGIGIDRLSADGDAISRTYFSKLSGYGRVKLIIPFI
ncbi:C40 family peptidase [Gloeocapsa sp. PCC 73106]|uniref:C40 family peptidase n=1 Tax=Gloeocapsa sp. PCC 73106 TaxID=102232 RepID=UPI0002ABD75A|nr:C40 family peptidase [Gloeocapsa sp. PCC 73106]ELR97006.1 cell wall-associated hydrolase, invasion-associated protein [Gloeocapsa sp. PCC 73106]